MALDLNEYIKMSYERPNRKVLEGLGASEDLIEYLMETPGNTNWNVIGSIGESGGGGGAEVWLVGDNPTTEAGMAVFVLRNVDATDHMTELFNNASNYDVYLNGVELTYYTDYETQKLWTDNSLESTTIGVQIDTNLESDTFLATAVYMNGATAPTSVEVSVKAK